MNRNGKRQLSKTETANRLDALEKNVRNISKMLSQAVVVNTILMNRFNITTEEINNEYARLIKTQTPIINSTKESSESDTVQSEHGPNNEDSDGSGKPRILRDSSDDNNQTSSGSEVQPGIRTEDDRSDTPPDPS